MTTSTSCDDSSANSARASAGKLQPLRSMLCHTTNLLVCLLPAQCLRHRFVPCLRSDMFNRCFYHPVHNLMISFSSSHTRSERISAEYQKAFYREFRCISACPAPVSAWQLMFLITQHCFRRCSKPDAPVMMRDTMITPFGWNR